MTAGTDLLHSNISSTELLPKAYRFLPSITDLLFLLLLISLTYGALAPRLLGDADIGWHIRDGQNIIATHRIPHSDTFSATRAGQAWFAWEWLYDFGIAVIYDHLGLNGVVLFSALVISLTLAMVFRYAVRRGGSVPVTVVLTLLCTVAASIHFLARPHVVGWLITVVWFWILDSGYRNPEVWRRLLWLPVLMLIWANLHGGFVLGCVLIAIFLLADVLELLRCHDPRQRQDTARHAKLSGTALILSVASSLVNPYGYKLHVHVYRYLSSRFLMQHIEEFRAPNWHSLPAQFFFLMLLMVLVGIAAARARLRWAEWLLILFSALSGLYAARNLPVASMLLTMIVPPLFSRHSAGAARPGSRLQLVGARMSTMELRLRGHLWPILLVIVSIAICLHHGRILGKQLIDAHFSPEKFPVQAVNFLAQRGSHEPVFSLDSWGGYLIYRLYPNTKVFIDDRHDFYGEPYLKDYLKVLHVEPGWQQVLDQEGVSLILLPDKARLAGALRNAGSWKVSYEDSVSTIFERSSR